MFYHGDEHRPGKQVDGAGDGSSSPSAIIFATWFPNGFTDKDYVISQYDGAVAYMDACIAAAVHATRIDGHPGQHHRRA